MPANPKKPKPRLTVAECLRLRADSGGVCLNCGHLQDGGVEPDAERIRCEACGDRQVHGIHDAIVRGLIEITD
jgi:hypothetical protein